jgi:hypothetical protein
VHPRTPKAIRIRESAAKGVPIEPYRRWERMRETPPRESLPLADMWKELRFRRASQIPT